jgi:hypothetical protein
MSWTIAIGVNNTSPYKYPFKIEKGQIFENKQIGTGFQNVAAISDYTFEIPANTRQTVEIEVLCINQQLKPPSGMLNLTNLQVVGTFTNQRNLWDLMNQRQII